MLLAVFGIGLPTAAVAAALESSGVTLEIDYGGETYGEHTAVTPGTEYTARMQYTLSNGVEPGRVVTVTVPDGVTFPEGVPAGNEAIESIAQDGNQVTITFKEEFPADHNDQGVVVMKFTLEEGAVESGFEELTWALDDQQTSQTVIVKKPGDEFRPELHAGLQKGASGVDWSSLITTTNTGEVSLADDITAVEIPYTLTLTSVDARTVNVADTIDDMLAYDQGSFSATVVTWDENGLNRSEESFDLPEGQPEFDGQSFAIDGLAVPANSIVRITYHAHVRDDMTEALQQKLEELAGELESSSGGAFGFNLANSAAVEGDSAQQGNVWIGANRPAEDQPGPDSAFDKGSDFPRPFVVNPDGEPVADGSEFPIEIPYALTADLTKFDDVNDEWDARWDLTNNVVLRDQLPEGMVWDIESLADNGLTAVEATDPLDESTFATTAEGSYYVDGRTLWVNFGQDVSRKWTITATALVTSAEELAKLPTTDAGEPQIDTRYLAKNTANFFYWDGREGTHQIDKIVTRGLDVIVAAGSAIEDENAFSKAIGELPKMTLGESYQVPFTFTIEPRAIEDLEQSQIIDEIDHTLFDVSEENLVEIKSSIMGSYDWQGGLTGDDFDLSLNADGELVLETSDAFGQTLPEWMTIERPLTKRLDLSLELPTFVIEGKQTIEITNSARVEGGTTNDWQYVNEATGSATSYGDELEVKKEVYDAAGESWTQNLRVPLDENGQPELTDFIYRVQMIPHGSFANNAAIMDIIDVLPEGTRLIGLVSDENLENGDTLAETELDIEGDLHVSLDIGGGRLVVSQRDGTKITGASHVNFKVALTDPKADIGIVNRIGSTQAVITPSNGYPLVIQKTDAQNEDVSITDRDARFTVTGPDGETITDVAFVVEGQLMVEDADGNETGIVIPENTDGTVPVGDYTITETVAPEGYELTETSVVTTIDESGTSSAVTIYNEPSSEPTPGPTPEPTEEPTVDPTPEPTVEPTPEPTEEPTEDPTPEPTVEPTTAPTEEPTPEPTEEPTTAPTPAPSEDPTPAPSEDPAPAPSEDPTEAPEPSVTPEPSEEPAPAPTEEPAPTEDPSTEPAPAPSTDPAEQPCAEPTPGSEDPAAGTAEEPCEAPAPGGAPEDPLSPTGGNMTLPLTGAALLMLMAGTAFFVMRRRARP